MTETETTATPNPVGMTTLRRKAAGKAAAPAAPKREKAAAAPAPKPSRNALADDAKITLLIEGNPHRPDTSAFRRFALLRSGMTVAEALAAGCIRPDLRYFERGGRIRIG